MCEKSGLEENDNNSSFLVRKKALTQFKILTFYYFTY